MPVLSEKTIRTLDEALEYMTECTLATVSDLAMKKSRSNSEFKRQKLIAQTGINLIKKLGVSPYPYSRVYKVLLMFDNTVESWAALYDCKLKFNQNDTDKIQGETN